MTLLIKSATFVSQGTTPNVDSFALNADSYAVVFLGYFDAAGDGPYTFGVNSDYGSDFFIDGIMVGNYYGVHPMAATSVGGVQYTLYLSKGYHKVYARFEEGSGGDLFTRLTHY